MRLWHKVFIGLMLCAAAYLTWVKLFGFSPLKLVSVLAAWLVLGTLAFMALLVTTERAYRPYPLGTPCQRKVFWQAVCWGPFILALLLLEFMSKRKDPVK